MNQGHPLLKSTDLSETRSIIVSETKTRYSVLNQSTGQTIDVCKETLKFVLPRIVEKWELRNTLK